MGENVEALKFHMRGNGGIPKLGWAKAGILRVNGRVGRFPQWSMQVYSRRVEAEQVVEIPIQAPWVGGIAYKQEHKSNKNKHRSNKNIWQRPKKSLLKMI